MASWLVALESIGSRAVDITVYERLTSSIESLGDVATYADGRYVAELLVPGRIETDAVKAALFVWRSLTADAGLPDWPVVRVEVTPLSPGIAAEESRLREARRIA